MRPGQTNEASKAEPRGLTPLEVGLSWAAVILLLAVIGFIIGATVMT